MSKEMGFLNINDEVYELVDVEAREDIETLQQTELSDGNFLTLVYVKDGVNVTFSDQKAAKNGNVCTLSFRVIISGSVSVQNLILRADLPEKYRCAISPSYETVAYTGSGIVPIRVSLIRNGPPTVSRLVLRALDNIESYADLNVMLTYVTDN